jgi:hypothetical protein
VQTVQTASLSDITAAFKRLMASSETAGAIEALRTMAAVCASCATDLDVNAMAMADAFDMAHEARVRDYSLEQRAGWAKEAAAELADAHA